MIPRHENGEIHVEALVKEAADLCVVNHGTGTICFDHITERLQEVQILVRNLEKTLEREIIMNAQYAKGVSQVMQALDEFFDTVASALPPEMVAKWKEQVDRLVLR